LNANAASTWLLGDNWTRRPVGVVADNPDNISAPLLDETFYLSQALAPRAEVRTGTVSDPDPGTGIDDLLKYGFGADNWFDCIVAEDTSRVVGFALYCRRYEAHTRSRTLWLADLCVAPDHRNKGVGKMLISALKTTAAELGCQAVALDLWTRNEHARRFYESVGAHVAGDLSVVMIPTTGTD